MASLAALGAAALAGGTGDARATVYYSGPITTNNKVGFDAGFATHAAPLSSGLGPAGLRLRAKTFTRNYNSGSNATHTRSVVMQGRTRNGARAFFNATFNGLGYGTAKGGASSALRVAVPTVRLASRYSYRSAGGFVSGSYQNALGARYPYELFAFFTASSKIDFGWIDLTVTVNSTMGPDVTINSYAYSDSGGVLPAGATDVPEPSSLALELTALGALVMGGGALRRWRAGRRQPAAA